MHVETLSEPGAFFYENSVVCAHCQGENTHLHSVETFSRREDADTGTHVVANIYDGSVAMDHNLARNPSSRRTAAIVYFSCEYCDKLTELQIIQHKGNDYLAFLPSTSA